MEIGLTDSLLIEHLNTALMESEQARQHSLLMARISRRLSSSLEYEVNLARMGQLIVPLLGDWCFMDLVTEEGTLERAQVIHANDQLHDLAAELKTTTLDPLRNGSRDSALCSRTSSLWSEITDPIELLEGSKHHLLIKSAMVIPLVVRDRTLGVFMFLITESQKRFQSADLALATEITDRAGIAIENSKLYSQARAAISIRDNFFAVVSHELKTPLTALCLQTELLLLMVERGEWAHTSIEKIRALLKSSLQNQNLLKKLIDDLLDFSSIRSGCLSISRKTFEFSDCILDVVSRYAQKLIESSCKVTTHLESCVGSWDPFRMEQVMTNLLVNAIKYVPGKPIIITLKNLGEGIELRLQDFGKGIPKEDHWKIFRKFERSVEAVGNVNGLGLGLYIVQQIISAHAGSIRVESDPDQGTTFVINLPMGGQ